jgi:6-pyruvoyltetrahydropterin/6-carboxytetrahydropterin synthase
MIGREIIMRASLYKIVTFDASHRLLHYVGKCNQLHGHHWKVEVWVEGNVDKKTQIIVDYNTIKKVIERYDHTVILNKKDPMVSCLERYQPVMTMPGDPTSELLADHIKNILENDDDFKRADAKVTRIKVWESPTSCAEIY